MPSVKDMVGGGEDSNERQETPLPPTARLSNRWQVLTAAWRCSTVVVEYARGFMPSPYGEPEVSAIHTTL